jgi:hypothetical protein
MIYWNQQNHLIFPVLLNIIRRRIDGNKQYKGKENQPTPKSVNTRKTATREKKFHKKRERLLAEDVIYTIKC